MITARLKIEAASFKIPKIMRYLYMKTTPKTGPKFKILLREFNYLLRTQNIN